MDISKYSVVDPRIVQHKPKYAVEKGALSITNQTFTAIANAASQQTYQVQVPSENVFVDRAVDWVNTANAIVTVSFAAQPTQYATLALPGDNIALAAFPMHQSVSTMTATINDQTVTVNTADVLPQVLRLADLAKTRMQRTCPTMLDRYQTEQSGYAVPNSTLGSWNAAYDSSDVPNGSWGQLTFFTAGVPQVGSATVAISTGNHGPVGTPYVSSNTNVTVFSFGVTWTTAEKLVLPPFIFADEEELSTGLFGVQNIQFTMNFNQPTRSVRLSTLPVQAQAGVVVVPGQAYSTAPTVAWSPIGSTPFTTAQIQVQFLTPSLDVPLPSKSVVQWMEFPRYISPIATLATTSGVQVQSQTITLPSIPDLLVLYIKPQSYSSTTQGDWTLPIQQISLNFDNFSGLLANHSQYELYKMSVNNGLDMDWDEWSGSAWVAGGVGPFSASGHTALIGGPLVLRPGRDFALQTGQAPGLVGNFTLQYNLTVDNSAVQYASAVSIYTITANSGFFETIKGSSRILKGVVTESDILQAPVAAVDEPLARMVGAAMHLGSKSKHASKSKGMHAYMR